MAEIKWIKIVTDIFDDEKILLIETLPEADSIIVIWFKLLCLAGKQNNSGVFMMSNGIPYTDAMLATVFRRKEATVKLALKTFQQFGMIEIINETVTITNWCKHQNFDRIEARKEYMRGYMNEYRGKQKALASGKVNSKVNSKVNVNSLDKNRLDKNDITFPQFWGAYPRKTAKKDALKAWQKLAPNEELLNTILTALSSQKESEEWLRDDGRYIPYPASWLNGRRWEDEVDEPEQPKQKKYRTIERDGQIYSVEVTDAGT